MEAISQTAAPAVREQRSILNNRVWQNEHADVENESAVYKDKRSWSSSLIFTAKTRANTRASDTKGLQEQPLGHRNVRTTKAVTIIDREEVEY